MKRLIMPLLIGVVGCAILISLGVWQVKRLAWKEEMLARIEAKIGSEPVPLPEAPDPGRDEYLPVIAEGTAGFGARVLASARGIGAGYRMIDIFETGDRRVLLDRGFLPVEEHSDAWEPQRITVTGNLHWPDETDSWTPEPELEQDLWFARDVDAMAAELDTEPLMIVARTIEPDNYTARPMPVGTEGIPNDHLQYSITWFSLALVWAGMTGLWLWRITRRTD
ncbi:SURF1 family protein [Pseudoruegeria sp. HB172150]|uniref:SURF1 family protein n=1 Tax=Pseudoruegeria sp. HB172150 TaxID=2721164 RepID=UPI001554107B|nr:SURF1 family protein [Pseudoruegeria sp. HB172150]